MQPAGEKAVAYARQVYEITSETQKELAKVAKATMTEGSQKLRETVDSTMVESPFSFSESARLPCRGGPLGPWLSFLSNAASRFTAGAAPASSQIGWRPARARTILEVIAPAGMQRCSWGRVFVSAFRKEVSHVLPRS